MVIVKIITSTFRIERVLKEALQTAAGNVQS